MAAVGGGDERVVLAAVERELERARAERGGRLERGPGRRASARLVEDERARRSPRRGAPRRARGRRRRRSRRGRRAGHRPALGDERARPCATRRRPRARRASAAFAARSSARSPAAASPTRPAIHSPSPARAPRARDRRARTSRAASSRSTAAGPRERLPPTTGAPDALAPPRAGRARAPRAPRRRRRRGTTSADERAPRRGAHRGDVARGRHEAAPARRPRHDDELAPEVHALDLLVDGPHELARRAATSTAASSPMPTSTPRARPRAEQRARASRCGLARPSAARAASGDARRLRHARRRLRERHDEHVPRGALSSMRIVPPCASTRRFTMERPSPVPPYSRVLRRVDLVERRRRPSARSRAGMPMPVSVTRTSTCARVGARSDEARRRRRRRAVVGSTMRARSVTVPPAGVNLMRVLDEVDEHLPQPLGVAAQLARGPPPTSSSSSTPFLRAVGRERRDDLAEHGLDADRAHRDAHRAALELARDRAGS